MPRPLRALPLLKIVPQILRHLPTAAVHQPGLLHELNIADAAVVAVHVGVEQANRNVGGKRKGIAAVFHAEMEILIGDAGFRQEWSRVRGGPRSTSARSGLVRL